MPSGRDGSDETRVAWRGAWRRRWPWRRDAAAGGGPSACDWGCGCCPRQPSRLRPIASTRRSNRRTRDSRPSTCNVGASSAPVVHGRPEQPATDRLRPAPTPIPCAIPRSSDNCVAGLLRWENVQAKGGHHAVGGRRIGGSGYGPDAHRDARERARRVGLVLRLRGQLLHARPAGRASSATTGRRSTPSCSDRGTSTRPACRSCRGQDVPLDGQVPATT